MNLKLSSDAFSYVWCRNSRKLDFKDSSETSSIASGDLAYDDDLGEENFISTPQCSQEDVTVDLMGCALSPLKKKCDNLNAEISLDEKDINFDEYDKY